MKITATAQQIEKPIALQEIVGTGEYKGHPFECRTTLPHRNIIVTIVDEGVTYGIHLDEIIKDVMASHFAEKGE